MKETVHEMWTIGTNRLNKEWLKDSEWWSSALGLVPYVSKTSPQEDYYVTKSMHGGNVAVVHIEGLYLFVVFCDRLCGLSSGQSFWLQIQRSRVRFPALPDFLNSGGSGTGSTQPREVN